MEQAQRLNRDALRRTASGVFPPTPHTDIGAVGFPFRGFQEGVPQQWQRAMVDILASHGSRPPWISSMVSTPVSEAITADPNRPKVEKRRAGDSG
jgi:hypothetical protein